MKRFPFTRKRADADGAEKTEKIRLSGEDFAAQNPYYAAIARMYHLAQLALFSILACFIILSMLIRSDDITYENFFYLFKDIHAAVDSADVSFTTLVYDADETQNFATYRGGLAVAGESGLTVFTATGRQTLTQSLNMTAPQLLTSSRYILVYEQGGSAFAVYNSFARLYAGKSTGVLSCAAISDAGWFALASQNGASSTVSVYDKHMNLKVEHFQNAYTTALALNEQGTLLAIATTDASGGAFVTRLSLYRPGTDELVYQWTLENLFPLSLSFADQKTLYLTSADRMLVLDQDGHISVDLTYDDEIIRAFHTRYGFALLTADGVLSIYGKDGSLLGQRADAADIRSVLVGKQTVYMMTDDTLMVYNLSTGESSVSTYDFTLQKMLWYSEEEILLCSRSKARYFSISD